MFLVPVVETCLFVQMCRQSTGARKMVGSLYFLFLFLMIQTTTKTTGVQKATIVYLRILIILFGSTFLFMGVEP